MTLIEGRFLASACAGGCGTTVYVVPHWLGAGRCIDCGRRHHGAAQPERPVPGANNSCRMGQGGVGRPGLLVDDRARVLEAARDRLAERAPVLAVAARDPQVSDGVPSTFWDAARAFGAVAKVGAWRVWRVASEKDGREAGYALQWRAAVAVPQVDRFWSVTTWRCWDGPAERWVRDGKVQVRRLRA